jgi:hypothetical protein
MTMLRIARKALLEYVREPLLLGLVFVFPRCSCCSTTWRLANRIRGWPAT